MRLTATIIILLLCLSCAKTIYVPIERKTVVTETIRDTIIAIPLKQYRDSVVVSSDTVSYLSNQYAYTYAKVSDGKLMHSLGIFPHATADGKVQYKEVVRIDSIPYPVVSAPVPKNRNIINQLLLIIIGVIIGRFIHLFFK